MTQASALTTKQIQTLLSRLLFYLKRLISNMKGQMKQFKGKVAVVTGASAGIGAAVVRSLANSGMKVVGLARRKEKMDELIKDIKSKQKFGKSVKVFAVKADMTKEEDIVQAFKWITENVGPVHVLINNAGIMVNTDIIDGDTQGWKKVMDTNVLGLTIATKEAIKVMTANKIDGHIINVNSLVGHLVPNFPKLNLYAASKYAVTALTETFRLELLREGSKIKITVKTGWEDPKAAFPALEIWRIYGLLSLTFVVHLAKLLVIMGHVIPSNPQIPNLPSRNSKSLSPGYVETELTQANNLMTPEQVKAVFETLKPLESVDIANSVLYILDTPPHVQVKELTIIPTAQPI